MQLPTVKNLDLSHPESFGNVAEKLQADERRRLADDLILLIKIDDESMSTWAGKAQGYLDEAKADEGNEHPEDREQEGSGEEPPPSTELTLTAVIQFAARATAALLGEPDLAKSSEPGGEKLASWVSSQLRTTDPNWTLDTDPLIVHMAVTGLAWRKRDFDDVDKVFHSHFVPSVGSNRVIINANVRSVERAPRVTHEFERYPYEIDRSIERGKWIDYEPVYDTTDPQAPKKFYECDCWLDLDGDELEEPWTITISTDDHPEVVRIRPRWSKKRVVNTDTELFFKPIYRFYPYGFLPDPEGTFLPMGFGKLLTRIESSADNLLGSITDTAKSEASNGGVYSGGGAGLPDKVEIKNNRMTAIPLDGRPLTDMLSQFPNKSVSAGSVQVLEKILTLGDRISGTLNMLENAPASMTATLAKGLIDNGTQVQGAVHRRIVASMTQELRMFVTMADAYDMLPDGINANDGGGVAVTADPMLATEMHRSAMAGLYLQMIELSLKGGGPFDVREAALRYCMVMRLPDPEKLIAQPQPAQASPWEKMQGAMGLMKAKTENIKTIGGVAVDLTTALKNMVDASGGMLDQRMMLLQMSQLEKAVQQLMQQGSDAGNFIDGMAQQPGNASPGQLPAPPEDAGAPGVLGGQPG